MNNNGKLRFYVTEQLSENIAETPEGFLVCSNVPITRIGEFIYRPNEVPVQPDSEGIVRIQRDEADVFSDDTIKSFEGKPVTIDHPDEPVTPDNWSALAHGTAQNVRRGEGSQMDLLVADILITTGKAIELVKSGLREISCGYDANYEQIAEGMGRQKDIVGNHVALVSKGRAGARCAIADKACTGCGECNCNEIKAEQEVSMKFKDKISELKKWLDRCPVKDADESEEEKARKEKEAADAKAAKDAKDQEDLPKKLEDIKDTYDKWLKDAAEGKLDVSKLPIELKDITDADEEEEKKKLEAAKDAEEKEKEIKEKEMKDQGELADLHNQIGELRSTLQEIIEEGEVLDKKAKDAEEAAKAEEEKKAFEEKKSVEDSWPEILHRVEVLNPSMKVAKPTKDFGKTLREIKVSALAGAFTRDEDRESVEIFVSDGDFSKLSKDSLDAAFIGASELIAKSRNSKVHRSGIQTNDHKDANTVRSINEKNAIFYKRKVA